MSDCQSFQGIIQPISQNSNFGKITILRNALFQLKWVIASRFKVYYNPFHSNFQLPLKAIKLLEKRERKEGHTVHVSLS